MRIEPGSGTPLAAVNVAIAAALLVVPWTGTLIGDPARGVRGSGAAAEALTHGWVFAAQTAAVGTILAALTGLECLGILFVAARRGWRPTRAGAWQICCHATAGWILCGLLPLLALAGMFSAVVLFRAAPGGVLDLRPVVRTPLEWGVIVSGGSLMAGYLGGFLAFQGLVAVGVRRCRYANAPGEGAETPGREAGLPEGGAGSLREPVSAA